MSRSLMRPSSWVPRAAVFRDAAAFLSDMVGWAEFENDISDMGIAVFDSLSQGQSRWQY